MFGGVIITGGLSRSSRPSLPDADVELRNGVYKFVVSAEVVLLSAQKLNGSTMLPHVYRIAV